MDSWANRDEFRARVLEWAGTLGIEVQSIAIRPMRRKWASCSTAGRLNFNDELLSMDREIGDYVIVHELLHFTAPNHGPLWKMLMRAHLGNYEAMEARLRAEDALEHYGGSRDVPRGLSRSS